MVYQYYDSPEGEDVFKKLWVTNKYALAAGLAVSTADVMLYSYPKGYAQTIARYIHFTGPFMAMASTFTITSNLLVSIRKKDDKLNYFLGGAMTGSIMGAWRKSLVVGFLSAIAFGVAGCIKKMSVEEKWLFCPPIQAKYTDCNPRAWDWTLTKERPRNWTTGDQKN